MVTVPGMYAAVAWHQGRNASQISVPGSDGWWRPDAWWREEFMETDRARVARDALGSYLLDTSIALAHIGYMIYPPARPGGRADARTADLLSPEGVRAVVRVSGWLDEALYGQGRERFPSEERCPLQVTADSMARMDFCRMDFRRLVSDCLECGVKPAPMPGGLA